jgi:hypothetical protein
MEYALLPLFFSFFLPPPSVEWQHFWCEDNCCKGILPFCAYGIALSSSQELQEPPCGN